MELILKIQQFDKILRIVCYKGKELNNYSLFGII